MHKPAHEIHVDENSVTHFYIEAKYKQTQSRDLLGLHCFMYSFLHTMKFKKLFMTRL
jgi:DMSO/TMAO reductase YedYZ heme-binding membrane subunit